MRGLSTVLLAGLCLSGTGCWVLEEIDKGQAILEHHSSAPKNKAAEEADGAKSGGGFSLAALKERGADAFKDISGRVEEALKKEPDPENVVVRCWIEGRMEYARKFDCQSKGGRIAQR